MARVEVYTTTYCAHCYRAKLLLDRRGIAYDSIDVTGNHDKRAWLVATTGMRTVPQIFIDGKPIGGARELAALDKSGELAKMMG
jgi:glutaredoxin 3